MAIVLVLVMSCVTFAATSASAPRKKSRSSFTIQGSLSTPLRPGDRAPLKLTIKNRKTFTLRITRLKISVRIDRAHAIDGCSASRDFVITKLPRKTFPIRVPAKRKGPHKTIKRVRIRPVLEMRNLSGVNQDACKGAKLKFVYSGRAVVKPKRSSAKASGTVTSK